MTPEERAFEAARGGAPAPAAAPRRRLSLPRVAGLLLAIALVAGSTLAFRSATHHARPVAVRSAFMPYVDATSTPTYPFENGTPATVVLGFVVSSAGNPCQPAWGQAYSLTDAASQLDLDRRIARYTDRGGRVVVSFGGLANSELATGCTNPQDLAAGYRAVVDRYSLSAIDLDIEGDAALAADAMSRRAIAIHQLQDTERAAHHRALQVWLTLPVDPRGLTNAGRAALAAMLAAHVELAGVNGLTMDYGSSKPAGMTLTAANEAALTHLAAQVRSAYGAAGRPVSAAQSWQLIGATPMIGQNDTPDERFGPADATALVRFAMTHHLRRLSTWSLNRDQACGPNYANVTIVSPNCSGIAQRPGQFTKAFARFRAGAPLVAPASAAAPSGSPSSTSIVDDPAASPYPIWNPALPYPAGTKIVWHRNVYQAKWWTQGDTPDLPVASVSQTPWSLVGPVLPGEHPQPTPTLSAGTYPQWSAAATYRAGARVLYEGVGYQAKWFTQGDVPGVTVSDPGQTPWQLITSA